MGKLAQKIKQLISDENYVVGVHARDRLFERGIMLWQVASSVPDSKLIAEFTDAVPHPKIELKQLLPDGTEFKGVWSLLAKSNCAKLVTVHFFNRW